MDQLKEFYVIRDDLGLSFRAMDWIQTWLLGPKKMWQVWTSVGTGAKRPMKPLTIKILLQTQPVVGCPKTLGLHYTFIPIIAISVPKSIERGKVLISTLYFLLKLITALHFQLPQGSLCLILILSVITALQVTRKLATNQHMWWFYSYGDLFGVHGQEWF